MQNTVNLKQFAIKRPEKLRWVLPNNTEDVLALIKSKSLRSFLKRTEELIEKAGIKIIYKDINESEYLNWLPYYREKMKENDYDIIADEAWYQQRINEGKYVYAIFSYFDGKIKGSIILTKYKKELATVNFKANDKIDIFPGGRSSLGAILDYTFIKIMKTEGFHVISAGVARNAAGVVNTFSYLDYKLRFGYFPVLAENTVLLDEVPVNMDGVVLFYGMKDNKMSMYGFKPKGSNFIFEQARFATKEIPFEEIEY